MLARCYVAKSQFARVVLVSAVFYNMGIDELRVNDIRVAGFSCSGRS